MFRYQRAVASTTPLPDAQHLRCRGLLLPAVVIRSAIMAMITIILVNFEVGCVHIITVRNANLPSDIFQVSG
jgi:hypothetical protein